ncbi:hypothetical protein SEA_VORVOLAKOS_73 [Streptomyces phage Vorvolakos]|uniref:Uncharacterized protein n=3 Tax=Flowerpowervirus flowerpower TaxID=2846396 RepID=A0A2U8UNG2_9CAUD|nr:hypothetical protein HWB61_gp29 [Streptomyces phage FlowerPower]QEA11274.1 hypothetical protein SEA_GEOSTIN_67 [Streptomyces phage Geostin]QFP94772.1 hypothetical protein SEA_FABIAN_71 [Streptomyces phage Fabian]QZD97118.1 hypothetical protein SEA_RETRIEVERFEVER_72 [Streptomyces phage RetrieverFever]UOW93283.1 hypothetical protein SEA_VORVOLAKOS_73 [Streptomyces phage Vorvolakos]AWN05153.1 hypothetical protein SEA_FLOWERPOWER_72 [Streptomyces phage FlowerPower]
MLACKCGSSYRSPGDYMLAIKMGWDVEYTHALLDLWEDCLDEVLDKDDRQAYLDELKEEYGRTVTTRPDQADS